MSAMIREQAATLRCADLRSLEDAIVRLADSLFLTFRADEPVHVHKVLLDHRGADYTPFWTVKADHNSPFMSASSLSSINVFLAVYSS